MKTRLLRYIFPLIFFACLQAANCFGQAPVFAKLTGNLTGSMTAGDQHKAVLGFRVTVPSGNSITFSQFTFGCSPGTSNAFLANGTLYRFPSGTTSYSTTGGVPVGNVIFDAGTITITDLSETISGSSNSYFLVADAVNTSASYFQLVVSYNNTFAIDNNGNTYPAHYSDNEGYSYQAGTPYSIKVANATNGLSPTSTALVSTSTDVALFGFSLASSSGTKNISQIYINSNLGTVSNYFSNFRLYTTSTSDTFTSTTSATPVSGTFTVVGQGSYVKFVPTTSIAASTSLKYYWLVADVSLTGTLPVFPQFSFAYGQSQNAFTASGDTYNNFTATGPTYNINYAGVTITKLTGGLSSGTITAAQTDLAVFGFDIAASGTVSISEININSNGAATYFNNPKLYWTNTTTYSAGTRHLVASGSFVGNFAHFTGITSETITNDTRHYFLVVDNIAADASNPTIAFNFTNGQSSNAIVQTSPAPSTYNNFNIMGNNYTIPSPTIFVTALNDAVSNNITTTISPGASNIAVFGFKVRAIGALTVNEFNFDFPAGSNGTYFSNAKVYYSSDEAYSAGDVSIGNVDLNSSYAHIGSLGLSLNNETRNYFLVVDVKAFNNSTSPATVYFRFDHTQNHAALILDPYKLLNTYDIPGATLNFPPNTTYIWTGNANNTSFTNSSNWSKYNGYPGSTSDVVIPGGADYYPNLTATTTIASLTFTGTAPSITIVSGKSLQINSGLILADGTTPTITGGTISLPNGSVSTIAATAVLKLGANTIINNSGTFTIKSDATGTGAIGAIPNTSSITGNVNVERFFTGGGTPASNTYRAYRLISSPVNNGLGGLSYLYTGGPGGTGNGFSFTNPGTSTVFLYREDVATNTGSFNSGNYKGIAALNTSPFPVSTLSGTYSIYPGTGIMVYYVGSTASGVNYGTRTGSPAYYPAPDNTTMVSTGTLNQGNIPVKLWYNSGSTTLSYTTNVANTNDRGLTLVGNPYASTIDWNTFTSGGIDGTNVASTVYIYNYSNKTFGAYQAGTTGGTGTNNASRYISSGQGFFVKATGTGASLTFHESAKTATQPNSLGASYFLMGVPDHADAQQMLRIKLTQDNFNNEDILLSFEPNATDTYETNYDADHIKGVSNLVSLSSFAKNSGKQLSINHMHSIDSLTHVKLNFTANAVGIDTLSATGFETLDPRYDVYLLDHYKKDSLMISQYDKYFFNITPADTNSFGSTRFELVFHKKPSLANYQLLSFTGKKVDDGIQLTWKTQNETNFTGFTIQRADGSQQFLALYSLQSDGNGNYTYTDQAPAKGINQYRLMQNDAFSRISYSPIISVDAQNVKVFDNNLMIYPNPVIGQLQVKVSDGTASSSKVNLTIMSASGQFILSKEVDINAIDENVDLLQTGSYILQITDTATKKVIGRKKFIKL